MPVYRIELGPRLTHSAHDERSQLLRQLRSAGLSEARSVRASRLFLIEGRLSHADVEQLAGSLLADPVVESATICTADDPLPQVTGDHVAFEVHPRPGVMDPVALSTHRELQSAGYDVDIVRTGRRFIVAGPDDPDRVHAVAARIVANDCIEQLIPGAAPIAPAPRPPIFAFELRHVALRDLDDAALDELSRAAHLFLSRAEMQTIRAYFQQLDREPTDLELETLAQTWSEHCVHKTLRSAIVYRGAALPDPTNPNAAPPQPSERHYDNLLRDTIAKATDELITAGRGPQCLSVFKDNAGVITFDNDFGIAFKVETHNHPSAIEPYGGAATGIGGVIRDVIGCGLGARPIANTDVFCVAPGDWPLDKLPKGVLHPARVLRGVVGGVADYGNRMGIPTVNGAVYFDPRYLGNPLVFAGSVGLIPRDRVEKHAQPGDRVVVIGGRTGRDGIHGATFSSAELTDSHADEFSHAVQIGNAITEKRFLDAIMHARDADGGCLYTAITDCGAGGLSSAVGEMGEEVGVVVDLDDVPLKYAGLRYDEIWISEAQERMVVAVPPDSLNRFLEIMANEEVEATVIGTFGHTHDDGSIRGPRLTVRYAGTVVGDLDMQFLHHGVPKIERIAEWSAPAMPANSAPGAPPSEPQDLLAQLQATLARPNVASKAWIIRQYDHEVQGGSVIKPLVGPGRGPSDGAVLQPRLASNRAIALGCGLAPHLSDQDPYWMAAAAIDEALRNVVCVGGNPSETAILDNFCWGSSEDPYQLGALVRACQACYDAAVIYGVPFISGKDSLNNEFALDAADVELLIQVLNDRAAIDARDHSHWQKILPHLAQRLRTRRRLAIPPTLLISALSIVPDVRRCVTPDLKSTGGAVLLVGGLPVSGFSLNDAAAIHQAVARLISHGHVRACHDVSDGGWLTALAEMCIAGDRGVALADHASELDPWEEQAAAYLIEPRDSAAAARELGAADISCTPVANIRADAALHCSGRQIAVSTLRQAWSDHPA